MNDLASDHCSGGRICTAGPNVLSDHHPGDVVPGPSGADPDGRPTDDHHQLDLQSTITLPTEISLTARRCSSGTW